MPAAQPHAETGFKSLSLADYSILGLVAERPVHGFAVSRLVDANGQLGRIYRIPRPIVYRTLDRLAAARLIRIGGVEPGQGGPQRTTFTITPAGRRALDGWLGLPVDHIRDLRQEFLVKLALLERAGADIGPLICAQHDVVVPIAAALAQQLDTAVGFDRILAAWRYETAQASLRFLAQLAGAESR